MTSSFWQRRNYTDSPYITVIDFVNEENASVSCSISSQTFVSQITFLFLPSWEFHPPGQTVGGASDHVATYVFSTKRLLPMMGRLVFMGTAHFMKGLWLLVKTDQCKPIRGEDCISTQAEEKTLLTFSTPPRGRQLVPHTWTQTHLRSNHNLATGQTLYLLQTVVI